MQKGKAMAGDTSNGGEKYSGHSGHSGRRRVAVWTAVIAVILLVPMLAMQVTEEVDYSVFDFVFAGVVLAGAAAAYELAAKAARSAAYRAAVGVAIAAAVFLIWVTGAVGIIGSEDNPANLMYGGVLAVGIAGAAIARLRPAGMARTLVATACAQALVAVTAVIAGLGSTGQRWPLDVLGVTAIFVVLWLVSAALFNRAERVQTQSGRAP